MDGRGGQLPPPVGAAIATGIGAAIFMARSKIGTVW